eukprot:6517589-Prymnesium_polylepis.2
MTCRGGVISTTSPSQDGQSPSQIGHLESISWASQVSRRRTHLKSVERARLKMVASRNGREGLDS